MKKLVYYTCAALIAPFLFVTYTCLVIIRILAMLNGTEGTAFFMMREMLIDVYMVVRPNISVRQHLDNIQDLQDAFRMASFTQQSKVTLAAHFVRGAKAGLNN